MPFGKLHRVALVRTDVSENHRLHLQVNEILESSQLPARICLTTDGEENLIYATLTVEFTSCHRVTADVALLRRLFLE
jgi:hypothetical protein